MSIKTFFDSVPSKSLFACSCLPMVLLIKFLKVEYIYPVFFAMIAGNILTVGFYYVESKYIITSRILNNVGAGTFPALLTMVYPDFFNYAFGLHFLLFYICTMKEDRVASLSILGFSNFAAWTCAHYWFLANESSLVGTSIHAKLTDPNAWQYYVIIFQSYGKLMHLAVEKGYAIFKRNEYEAEILDLNNRLAKVNGTLTKNNEEINVELAETNEKLKVINAELKAALTEKENFILRFSHEIRNPLNSLLGNLELVFETALPHKAKDMLKDAKICGEILLHLLTNVLDTGKISSKQLETSIEPYNVREFSERVWVLASEMIRKKGLYGTLLLDWNMPEYIDFDQHRLMQILMNLVLNATKFTEEGYVKVHFNFVSGKELNPIDMQPKFVSIFEHENEESDEFCLSPYHNHWDTDEKLQNGHEILTVNSKRFSPKKRKSMVSNFSELRMVSSPVSREDASTSLPASQDFQEDREVEQEGYLRIEIIDTGCGIQAEQIRYLFQKFGQVNEDSQKRQIGTGLGLWISQELVELMDGQIKVYSTPNVGTCFVIMIKSHSRIMSPKKLNRLRSEDSIFGISSKKTLKRCLMVEDSPYNQEINRKFLEKCQIQEVVTANHGLEALEIYKAKGKDYFDFILSDLDMPIMDGREFTKCVREHDQKNGWDPIKIAILTAYSAAAVKNKLLGKDGPYRADIFLSKPLTFNVLEKTLKEFSQVETSKLDLVLVADDDMFNLDIFEKMVVSSGLGCIVARDGAQAVDMYEKHKANIKLVLMDCEMPIMSGWDASEQIAEKLRDEDLAWRVPIIGLVDHVENPYDQRVGQCGMKKLIRKSIALDELRKLLSEEIID